MTRPTPAILLILDGWGQAPAGAGNAVSLANAPTLHALPQEPLHSLLNCSGREVGLPHGFMGNSEVGHLNIGAGRIVYQDITRIDVAIEDGSFAKAPAITAMLAKTQQTKGTLHLLGLLSDGGVHSHINHILTLVQIAQQANIPVALHMFMDGRDTGPTTGIKYLKQLQQVCGANVHIASLSGRYYAMDRDKRWERTACAWNGLVHGEGTIASDPVAALEAAYAAGVTDEFIQPILVDDNGTLHTIKSNDSVFFCNFRADRARQLSYAFAQKDFSFFDRKTTPELASFTTMTQYDATLPVPCAFPPQQLKDTLGETVAKAGLSQLRIAETEKYAHVTYFFNGGVEEPFPNEDRVLIQSPKDVPTYDLKPEMSVHEVTQRLLEAWNAGTYDLIICNFANLDMVGHSGKIPATIQACEVVDACVHKIIAAVKEKNGRIFITADHGNAEQMLSPTGEVQTSHSTNPVAFTIIDNTNTSKHLIPVGKLGDIAPTILYFFHIQQPAAMTGKNLVEPA